MGKREVEGESTGLDDIRPPHHLAVRLVPGKGRGVFATEPIPGGAIIEVCPVIALSGADRDRIEPTALYDYYFDWGADRSGATIALGYGSLYNHSYAPNARYLKHPEAGTVEFLALRDIEPGEEITVNYKGEPTSREPLWFEPVL